jgi:hypothetical protein
VPIRTATTLAYFPGMNRYDLIRSLGTEVRADEVDAVLTSLMRAGYIQHARHVWGGYETDISEWRPDRDSRDQIPCLQHGRADESIPLRAIT